MAGRFYLQCRVCRSGVVQDGHLLQSSCNDQVCDSNSLWYIKDDNMPEWIYEAVSKEAWQKGKLSCTKCKGRLGSFNFIKTLSCPDCHQHTLPPVHILKDRVDVKFVGNYNVNYSGTQRPTNPQNLNLQGASIESEQKQNETSFDDSCLATVSDNNRDNLKSNDLAFPEKRTVIKNSICGQICSPNEPLPDSPSFQNAQDTDSEPVGQSSQDNTNFMHCSDAHMNKERYLEDMVKRTGHQNVCNLDFSWASVKHVSEKDIDTTKASKPSDLVTDGDREVDNDFPSFQISKKGKNSVVSLNAYENKNVLTLNHDLSNCGVLNDEENVISEYQLQTYEETAVKENKIIQEDIDSSEKEINTKLISGTEKTESNVDSVIISPCLSPREGADILTTNSIYLHEKPDLDPYHLESVTECERVQDYTCSIGSNNSTLLGDEPCNVSNTSLENQKSPKSSNLAEEQLDLELNQLQLNEDGTSCGHRHDSIQDDESGHRHVSIQDDNSGHRHDSFKDDDSNVKCRLITKECVSDYESLTGMREKFTEIRKLVENINMQDGYDHDDMENLFENTEQDTTMLNAEIRVSEFGMADRGDVNKVQQAAMQNKPELFDNVQQTTIQNTSKLFDNELDNSILLGAYSEHSISEATSITSNPFNLRSSSVLEEGDFMFQPFNNSTETEGQNLESDQNRGSINGENVDVDISLTFDFLEADGRRGRKRRNRRTRREKKGRGKEKNVQKEEEKEIIYEPWLIEFPEEHVCPVCFDLFCEPHSCFPCNHVLCEACLRRLGQKNVYNTPCPMCRQLIVDCVKKEDLVKTLKDFYPDEYRARLIEQKKYLTKKFSPLPHRKTTLDQSPEYIRNRILGHRYQSNPSQPRVKVILTGFLILVCFVPAVSLGKAVMNSAYGLVQDIMTWL